MNYFSEELGREKLTSKVIKQADLEYCDRIILDGGIVHLMDSGIVKSVLQSGYSIPYVMIISRQGIDKANNWISELIEILRKVSNSDYNEALVARRKASKLSEIWRIFNQNEYLRKKFFKHDYLASIYSSFKQVFN